MSQAGGRCESALLLALALPLRHVRSIHTNSHTDLQPRGIVRHRYRRTTRPVCPHLSTIGSGGCAVSNHTPTCAGRFNQLRNASRALASREDFSSGYTVIAHSAPSTCGCRVGGPVCYCDKSFADWSA